MKPNQTKSSQEPSISIHPTVQVQLLESEIATDHCRNKEKQEKKLKNGSDFSLLFFFLSCRCRGSRSSIYLYLHIFCRSFIISLRRHFFKLKINL